MGDEERLGTDIPPDEFEDWLGLMGGPAGFTEDDETVTESESEPSVSDAPAEFQGRGQVDGFYREAKLLFYKFSVPEAAVSDEDYKTLYEALDHLYEELKEILGGFSAGHTSIVSRTLKIMERIVLTENRNKEDRETFQKLANEVLNEEILPWFRDAHNRHPIVHGKKPTQNPDSALGDDEMAPPTKPMVTEEGTNLSDDAFEKLMEHDAMQYAKEHTAEETKKRKKEAIKMHTDQGVEIQVFKQYLPEILEEFAHIVSTVGKQSYSTASVRESTGKHWKNLILNHFIPFLHHWNAGHDLELRPADFYTIARASDFKGFPGTEGRKEMFREALEFFHSDYDNFVVPKRRIKLDPDAVYSGAQPVLQKKELRVAVRKLFKVLLEADISTSVLKTGSSVEKMKLVFEQSFYPLFKQSRVRPSQFISQEVVTRAYYIMDKKKQTGHLLWDDSKSSRDFLSNDTKQLFLKELHGSDEAYTAWLTTVPKIKQEPHPVPQPPPRPREERDPFSVMPPRHKPKPKPKPKKRGTRDQHDIESVMEHERRGKVRRADLQEAIDRNQDNIERTTREMENVKTRRRTWLDEWSDPDTRERRAEGDYKEYDAMIRSAKAEYDAKLADFRAELRDAHRILKQLQASFRELRPSRVPHSERPRRLMDTGPPRGGEEQKALEREHHEAIVLQEKQDPLYTRQLNKKHQSIELTQRKIDDVLKERTDMRAHFAKQLEHSTFLDAHQTTKIKKRLRRENEKAAARILDLKLRLSKQRNELYKLGLRVPVGEETEAWTPFQPIAAVSPRLVSVRDRRPVAPDRRLSYADDPYFAFGQDGFSVAQLPPQPQPPPPPPRPSHLLEFLPPQPATALRALRAGVLEFSRHPPHSRFFGDRDSSSSSAGIRPYAGGIRGFTPPLPSSVDQQYEDDEWNRFERRQHPRAVRDLIDANIHRSYYRYNALRDRIEPIPRVDGYRVQRAHSRGHPVFEEIYRLQPHPNQEMMEDRRLKRLAAATPLGDVPGKAADLGEYITLKILPRSIVIYIKKGVQMAALRKLAARIIEHRGNSPTQLLSRRTRKGRFTNFQWISSTELATMVSKALLDRLMILTKRRKRTVTIVVKQDTVGGAIHTIWETKHSLL